MVGRKCCIPNCKSNYGNTYVTVFRFPKELDLRALWLEKIPRDNYDPSKNVVVCVKHFEEDCVITHDILPTPEGDIRILRGTPKLKKGAYPTIFPKCPSPRKKPKKYVKKVARETLKPSDADMKADFYFLDALSNRIKSEPGCSSLKSDTTTVDHDVSGSLEMELNTVEPESDHETSPVPAIAMKEEPVSDPEDDAPYPGASTTPSLTSVTSLAKFPPSSGEILGVPFGDLPTRSPPPMSPGSEVSNSATNGGPDKTRFLPSTSPANDSGEEAKFVPDYRTRDQFDVYGEYIASKLRRLDWRTCAHVQKAFSDIIFDAEMGKYS